MIRCNHKGCGSYAFNLWRDGIDQGNLCDVHYWKNKAEEFQKEAMRYQWLRDTGDATWQPFGLREGYSAEMTDKAIDAAMQGAKP